jgi:hypothetical protein
VFLLSIACLSARTLPLRFTLLPIGSGYFQVKMSGINTLTRSSWLFFLFTLPMKMGQNVLKRQHIKFSRRRITQKRIQFLYCTVTTENAASHIVASIIRKWPHRETFSASSSCCMNLWIRGTDVQKILNVLLLQRSCPFSFLRKAIFILYI